MRPNAAVMQKSAATLVLSSPVRGPSGDVNLQTNSLLVPGYSIRHLLGCYGFTLKQSNGFLNFFFEFSYY